jgi:hypothetical protein
VNRRNRPPAGVVAASSRRMSALGAQLKESRASVELHFDDRKDAARLTVTAPDQATESTQWGPPTAGDHPAMR